MSRQETDTEFPLISKDFIEKNNITININEDFRIL